MKTLYLIVILILLILVVYYHNKSIAYQKFEHFDDNLINQIASIINKDKITLNNVDINGTLAVNNIKCLGGDQRVHVHNTLKVDGGNLDVPNVLSVNNINKLDTNEIKVLAPIRASKIITRHLYSTKEDNNDFINFNCGLYSPNNNLLGTISSGNEASKRTKIYINNDVDFNGNVNVNSNKTLTAKNLNTYNITSTNGVDSWVDVKSNINLYKTMKYNGGNVKTGSAGIGNTLII